MIGRRAGVVALWIAVGLSASLMTTLILFPSAWVAPVFSRATAGRVMLSDPQGSLWNGSARLMLSPGADTAQTGPDAVADTGATVMPYRITWHTQALPLLTGRLRIAMQEARPLSQPVLIDARPSGATVYAGSIDVPADLLRGLGAPLNTLDMKGDVRLTWTDWRMIGQQAYGQLGVDLTDMRSSIARVKPLGSYHATLVVSGQAATFSLRTVKGPLLLSGTGQMQNGHLNFSGRAQSTPDALANLTGLLNLLGPRIDAQSTALNFAR